MRNFLLPFFALISNFSFAQSLWQCKAAVAKTELLASVCSNHYFHSIQNGAGKEVMGSAGIVFNKTHYIYYDKSAEDYISQLYDEKLTDLLKSLDSSHFKEKVYYNDFQRLFDDLEENRPDYIPKYDNVLTDIMGERRFNINIFPLNILSTIRTPTSFSQLAERLGIRGYHVEASQEGELTGESEFISKIVRPYLGTRHLGIAFSTFGFDHLNSRTLVTEASCSQFLGNRFDAHILIVCPYIHEKTTQPKEVYQIVVDTWGAHYYGVAGRRHSF